MSVNEKIEQMEQMMAQRNYGAALNIGLEWTTSDIKEDPERTVGATVKALGYIRDTEIPKFIEGLDKDKYDMLMKIIYKGLSDPENKSSSLFKWHASLFAKSGSGSIVRVITDKKI